MRLAENIVLPSWRNYLMWRMVTGLIILLIISPLAWAEDKEKSATPAEQMQALDKEYGELLMETQKALNEATTQAEKQRIIKDLNTKSLKFAQRYLKLANDNPKDPVAFKSLIWVLTHTGLGSGGKKDPGTKALNLLERDHIKSDKLGPIVQALGRITDDAAVSLLRKAIKENPDHDIQGKACFALAQSRKTLKRNIEQIKGNDKLREAYEKQIGKEAVEKMLAHNPKNLAKEAQERYQQVVDKFADVEMMVGQPARSIKLSDLAKPNVYELKHLQVGMKAPDIESVDLDGKKVSLHKLRGKVVVLDFWATWCGPCKSMIPHERELVERLKDKPFVLVSINCDDKKEKLTKFLEDQSMPWTHWYNGAKGGIVGKWNVEFFPTIYVIDAKGVIRYKDVRGEDMDKAVDKLLKKEEKLTK
jgi:thiol-disulfide isomerase/thioredoxin